MRRTTTARIQDIQPGIGAPAVRALAAARITRLQQLTSISEAELLGLHGVGPKAIRILRAALAEQGLRFARAARTRPVSAAANARIARRPRGK